jgi:vitamin B12 transporter
MFPLLFTITIGAAAASPSPSPLPEIAHVYTSDRTDETLNNSARTTYIVTRADIARHGYRTVGEALERLPAFEYSPYGPIGGSAQYGVRGMNSSQVLVLIDGLPAPGSFANSVELGTMPTTGVDRIELVEGGGSTLYGTGSIGGIINVITDRKTATGATVRAGSLGEGSFELRAPNVQFSRIVARNDFSLADGSVRPDSDYQISALHANGGARVGSFDAVLRAGISSDRGGAPGPLEFTSPTSRQTDLNADANVTLTRRTRQAEFTVQMGGTRQQITFECNAIADTNCFQSTQSLDTESRLDFDARTVVSGENEQLLYGIDLARGTVRGDAGGLFSTNAFAQAGAYVQQKFTTRWGSAYAGLRGERDGSLGGEFSPSAGFVVRLSNASALKGNIATAFRAPNASELFFPFFGNPDLKPERAKVADLTLVDSAVLGGVSIGWFGNRTNNLIVTTLIDPVNFIFAPENIGHALIEGLTFDAKTLPSHGFTVSLNLTDLYRAQNLDTQSRLPDDPVLTANLGLDYAGAGLLEAAGASVHSVGPHGAGAFTRSDAYLSLRAAPNVLFTLRAYNFGNARYEAVSGFPMPGRTFAFELSTR